MEKDENNSYVYDIVSQNKNNKSLFHSFIFCDETDESCINTNKHDHFSIDTRDKVSFDTYDDKVNGLDISIATNNKKKKRDDLPDIEDEGERIKNKRKIEQDKCQVFDSLITQQDYILSDSIDKNIIFKNEMYTNNAFFIDIYNRKRIVSSIIRYINKDITVRVRNDIKNNTGPIDIECLAMRINKKKMNKIFSSFKLYNELNLAFNDWLSFSRLGIDNNFVWYKDGHYPVRKNTTIAFDIDKWLELNDKFQVIPLFNNKIRQLHDELDMTMKITADDSSISNNDTQTLEIVIFSLSFFKRI